MGTFEKEPEIIVEGARRTHSMWREPPGSGGCLLSSRKGAEGGRVRREPQMKSVRKPAVGEGPPGRGCLHVSERSRWVPRLDRGVT